MEEKSSFGNTRVNEEGGKYSITIAFLSQALMFLDTLWLSGTCSMDEGYDGYINIPGKKV
jgi:hypothetical protein